MDISPYPGLRPFKPEESAIFFGREQETSRLLDKLDINRFISVVGLSGCGKSSLVRAGLIPSLEAGFLSAGSKWRVAIMRPGNSPLRNLAESLLSHSALRPEFLGNPNKEEQFDTHSFDLLLASLHRGPRSLAEILVDNPLLKESNLLILVDQFEELFRYHREGGSDESDLFVALLLASVQQNDVPIYVVTTMRSEFIGECALYYDLPEMMDAGQFLTPRLTRNQQQTAIARPAEMFGGTIEPHLVNTLLNEMGAEPDQLPVLQHCLMRMWFYAHNKTSSQKETSESPKSSFVNKVSISQKDYEAVGSLKNALSNHADEAYNELHDDRKKIAEIMFRCLSERGQNQLDIRRPVSLQEVAEVVGCALTDVIEVVEVFRHPDRCFIYPMIDVPLRPDTVLDISHESLIRQWQRLNSWVEYERASAATYRHLEHAALLWKQQKAALWGSPNLDVAIEWKKAEKRTNTWAKRYGANFDIAMEFLAASSQAQEEKWLSETAFNDTTLNQIVRSIEFPAGCEQAGMSILSYFSTILRQKYPDVHAKVTIEQDLSHVRMIIETPEGQKEIIEETFYEYGRVILGKIRPKEFLKEPLQIMQLEQKLEMAKMELKFTKQLLEYERSNFQQQTISLEAKYRKLAEIVESSIRQPFIIQMNQQNEAFQNLTQKEENIMGDKYYNQGQVGAMGREAQASDNTFQQLLVVAEELSKLKDEMYNEATTPDQKAATDEVINAEQAARDGEKLKMMGHLKNAGKWALKKAEDIGTKIAVEVIKDSMGL